MAWAEPTLQEIFFALPGLLRHSRGAEIAFISVATELAKLGDTVTIMGSGPVRAGTHDGYVGVPSIAHKNFESFSSIPPLRNEFADDEMTFVPGRLSQYQPTNDDVILTDSYSFTNLFLRRRVLRGSRLAHVSVTQNGDWTAYAISAECRYFRRDAHSSEIVISIELLSTTTERIV